MESEERQISKYNDAVLSIQRLNEHWVRCEAYANQGQLEKWKFRLDSVWRELFPDVMRKKKNAPTWLLKNKELKDKIIKARNKNQLYTALANRHQFLRFVQDSAGKGGVYVDQDEDGFD